ncbi:MAG: recombination factor protein RarA, partial [Pigmentiphaga sp.]|nr:recombination factor protein RarA [Pigmentiphaga sp.]
AASPKSNSAYLAIDDALALVEKTGNLPVPLHLRNAPTKLMKDLDYGVNYKYSHDYPNNFVKQQFMPDSLQNHRIWKVQENAAEKKLGDWLRGLWGF